MFSLAKKNSVPALIAAGVLVAGSIFGAVYTSGAHAADEKTFAVLTHAGPADPFWQIVKTGAEDAGKALGVKVNYQSSPDPVTQSSYIDNAVAQKVSGIVVSMANPQGLKDSIEKAVKAGIPVIGINAGIEQWKQYGLLGFVGQDELIAGRGLGEKMHGQGKNAICVMGEQGNIALESRCKGFGETFGGKVTPLYVNVNDTAQAANLIQAKLQSDPSIDVIVTTSGVIGKATVGAITSAKSTAKLATFDTNADVVGLVQEGKIEFAVDQQPYLQGYLPITFLNLYLDNGNVVGGGLPVLTGPGFVTKDNADKILEFAKRGTR